MNTVAEIGRLTKDVELKKTPNGKTYGRFTLAVNRRYKNSNGTYDADYFNCVVWGLTAENLAKFTKKGSLIGVSGTLQSELNFEFNIFGYFKNHDDCLAAIGEFGDEIKRLWVEK